jgi:glycosyltransferase involved in cell wall biosynthesis
VNDPVVSVIVPCFNQAHFLGDCLNSVKRQNFTEWECIIVDDGSNDNTGEVAQQYCQEDARFRYHRQVNKGLSGARNTGIAVSKGLYLNFLDSDDALYPEALKCMISEFASDPDLVMVYGGYTGAQNSLTRTIKKAISDFDSSKMDFYPYVCAGNALPVHAALVKKSVIDRIGVFDETLKSCEDWDFWLRLARTTNAVKVIRQPLVVYRITSTSMTRNVEAFFKAGITVIERTIRNDERVKDPLEKYRNGYTSVYTRALVSWYSKCVGLYIAQQKISIAKELIVELKGVRSITLNAGHFLYIWKQIMFGAVLFSRKKAWRAYGASFMEVVAWAESLYEENGFKKEVQTRIETYNAGRVKRIYLRLFKWKFFT